MSKRWRCALAEHRNAPRLRHVPMPRCRRAGLAADEKKPAWEAGFVPSAIAFLRLAGRTESVARSALRRDDDR
ncbi:hypothetical protein SB780_33890, partial [Burkholderia sp. SIMBA_057]